jgi:hypothetical protein
MPLLDFPFFGWLRDLLGIHKDIIDTKKSKLEIQKLQDEELARNLITRATIADIEKYDPKYARIKATAISGSDSLTENGADKNIRTRHWLWFFFGIFGLLGLIFALYNSLARLSDIKLKNKTLKINRRNKKAS